MNTCIVDNVRTSTTIERENTGTVEFPWQQWLRERVITVHYTYSTLCVLLFSEYSNISVWCAIRRTILV